MRKKETDYVTIDPPMAKSQMKYMVLRIRSGENGNEFFVTSGGEYRYDFYELVFQSDSLDEARDFYMKLRYDPKKPL